MEPVITQNILTFLKDLKLNNNREWFLENKPRFEEAKKEFEFFIDALIQKIAEFDKSVSHLTAKDCVFRIYRDVRFSKDKSPYKTHFGAHITPFHRKSEIHNRAGYYIHIEPEGSVFAGGAYLPPSDWLANIRKEISGNPSKFKKIINAPEFVKFFREVEGERLKKAPRGFSPKDPEIELLKLKSYMAVHYISEEDLTSPKLISHAAKVFKAYQPFADFLNRLVPESGS